MPNITPCRNLKWCKCICHLDAFTKENDPVRAAVNVLYELWAGNFHADPAAENNPSALNILRITFETAFLSSISDEAFSREEQNQFMGRMWDAFVKSVYGKSWSLYDLLEATELDVDVSDVFKR